ncbi:7TM diverse intracellular signaling domain-containing protein [Aquimarina sp. 2304DJ70-9]|uniref:7TM diverse intracellular signaling domain-containing protein n=1 Tax=Aquimarina penaris TaxID=3231044 RepID=UPI003462E599
MNSSVFSPFVKVPIPIYVFFLFFMSVCSAQDETDIVPIDGNTTGGSNFLGKHIESFQEDGRSLSIESISKKNFTESKKDILNFGYSNKAVWLRFRIKNSADTSIKRILSIRKSLQDSIQFFYKENNTWKMLQSGQMIAEKDKKLPGYSISFPLEIKEKHTSTFYIRTISKFGKTFAIKLFDQPNYYKNEQIALIICCLLIGVLLTVTTYNFFLARALKDPVYFIYCITVLGTLAVQLHIRGFTKLYVIDNNPFLQEWGLSFTYCFATICSSYFCIRFLDAKTYSKYADWALKSIIVFIIIAILYPLINYEFFNTYTDVRFSSYSGVYFSVVAIFSGIVVYYKGNKYARFLIFGWSIYFLGITLYSLGTLNFIPGNTFTLNAYLIGSVFEVFMLSSALADRYKQLKTQRIQLGKEIVLKEQEIVHKNDKISSLTVETLKYIKSKQHLTEELKKVNREQEGITIKEVITSLQADKIEDKKLEILKQDIDALNIEYTNTLKVTYPTLTKGDIELASFVLLGLTRKEIAVLRNTSFDAVKKSMYRLRKKIDITPEESLEKFIISLHEEQKSKEL